MHDLDEPLARLDINIAINNPEGVHCDWITVDQKPTPD
jgi:hypothetical protein